MGRNVVVIGTQWGDEGKGKVVDLLTEEVSAVVRFQGPNGHSAGPWAAVGGTLPGERAPLAFHGRRPVGDTKVDLSDQEQEMLEALGYIQD